MELSTSLARLMAILLLTGMTVNKIRWFLRNRIKRKGYPLPPGPTPLPLLGSAFSVDAQQMWLTFTEWKAKYGDIMYIRIFNTDLIVLNSTSAATELLERRSDIYSDRPSVTAIAAPYYDFNFALAQYGEKWRLCRRIFLQTFRADAAVRFRPMQLRKAQQLVVNVINNLEGLQSYFSTFSAGITLSAAYNYETSSRNDPMVYIIEDFLRISSPGLAPLKAALIEAFPFLLRIPDWLPGSWIKRDVQLASARRDEVVEKPYQYIQERMGSNDTLDVSMVSDHVARMERSDGSYRPEYKTALKHASATVLNSGTNTTSSTLMVFALAMVENPRVWKRAQVEIDSVVGTDRLPEFEDRPSLPYVDAIIREVLRWRPVLPLGGMHAVTRSDIYKGYYIPKGASVAVNAWAISRDTARYPDADKFIPERFLNADGMLTDDNPSDFVFGFGRRICPGRYLADASLWSAVVTMLAMLDFNLAKDANGNDITFKATFTHGILERPNPFPCQLTPRAHAREVIGCVLPE